MTREGGKGVLLGSAPCSAEGHIPSLSTAFHWDKGVHGPRLVIFGIVVIGLNEKNSTFSLPVKSVSGTGMLQGGLWSPGCHEMDPASAELMSRGSPSWWAL